MTAIRCKYATFVQTVPEKWKGSLSLVSLCLLVSITVLCQHQWKPMVADTGREGRCSVFQRCIWHLHNSDSVLLLTYIFSHPAIHNSKRLSWAVLLYNREQFYWVIYYKLYSQVYYHLHTKMSIRVLELTRVELFIAGHPKLIRDLNLSFLLLDPIP